MTWGWAHFQHFYFLNYSFANANDLSEHVIAKNLQHKTPAVKHRDARMEKLLYETTTDAEDSESFLLFSERDEQRVENSLENNSRAKT